MKKYIVVNIGCIECGVTSNIVGVFTDKDIAESIARELSLSHGWRERGQNRFQVFDMPVLNTIHHEYLNTENSPEGDSNESN